MGTLSRLLGTALGGIIATTAATAAFAAEAKLTLEGRVADANAKPVAGATVHIYTAQPRIGFSSVCPSCYPECGKSTTTDRRGRFQIKGLDAGLLYRLLFVADGRTPAFRDRVDPALGPVEQTVLARDTALAPGLRTTIGHVVDMQGRPVPGASVFTRGVATRRPEGEGVMYGDVSGFNARIDPLAITDGSGEFRLTGPDSIVGWVVDVKARNLSPRVFTDVVPGGSANLLRLDAGAIVTGVVERDGQPVPGAVLGLAQVDRGADHAVEPDTIACDDRGRFTFANVPANEDYAMFGVVGSMGPWALRTVVRTVGEAESTTVIPALALEPGMKLGGRVSLSDGRAIPAGTELGVHREFAAAPLRIRLGPDGRFQLEGLPPETILLTVRVRGYRIQPATRGYAGKRSSGVRLAMLRDREDVEIVLEPDTTAPQAATPRP